MMVVRFTVLGKPQPLERARLVRMRNGHVRHYTPKDSVAYQEKVRRAAIFAGCPLFGPGATVELLIYFPDRRNRDADNVGKGLIDALQPKRKTKTQSERRAIAWLNDNHVHRVDWRVSPEPDKEHPRVEVLIRGELAVQPHVREPS